MKLFFLIFLIVESSIAGIRDIGNGGEVITCRNAAGALSSIEVLDSYEARILRGFKVKLGDPANSVSEKVNLVFDRVSLQDKSRAARYAHWYKNWDAGIRWQDEALPATPDVDPSLIPKNCKIEQIAIQRNTTDNQAWYDYGLSLKMNRPLWNALDNDQKAVLILHEIFYHEALYSDFKSAEPIRYLNSLYFSDEAGPLMSTPLKYAQILESMGFNTIYFNGVTYYHPAVMARDWVKSHFYADTGLPRILYVFEKDFKNELFLQKINILGSEVTLMHSKHSYNREISEVVFENRFGYYKVVPIDSPVTFRLPNGTSKTCDRGYLQLENGLFKKGDED